MKTYAKRGVHETVDLRLEETEEIKVVDIKFNSLLKDEMNLKKGTGY